MTDLEMTKLCAEAMGFDYRVDQHRAEPRVYLKCRGPVDQLYDPRNDDAQAMALVKRFRLNIEWTPTMVHAIWRPPSKDDECIFGCADTPDLCRAVVECVANIATTGN